jgi:cyclic pyranopterin phosphate synthase
MPSDEVSFISRVKILRYEEILCIADIFIELGIEKIRITGGEPLIRHGVLFLLEELARRERLEEITLTTNGLMLGEYAAKLCRAGIERVNVSIDTLKVETYEKLTGTKSINRVLRGIETARGTGLRVKLNIVAMRGVNDDEFADFVLFGIEQGCDIRFIEVMPQIYNKTFASELYIPGRDILKKIGANFKLTPLKDQNSLAKERFYRPEGHSIRIGIISPISDPFCARCNRLRLMPDGELKSCLFSRDGVNLRDLIRKNASIDVIKKAIYETVKKKPEMHSINQDETGLVMHRTGG